MGLLLSVDRQIKINKTRTWLLNKFGLQPLDIIIIIILVSLAIGYLIKFGTFSVHPLEDAAMLMRYSQNLANNHGIVWNIGDAPVDGATDFLFMVSVAILAKMGIAIENSVRIIDVASYIFTAITIYFAIRQFHRSNYFIAFISVVFFILGPGIRFIGTYFGTPYFAFLASLTWYYAIMLYKENSPSHRTSFLFAFFGLITALIRPDGCFLVAFMLVGLVIARGFVISRLPILYFLSIFGVLGGIYFLWHWNYFGYPLPNPFYIKGSLSLNNLESALLNVLNLTTPFYFAFFLAFRSSKLIKYAMFAVLPIIGYTCIWMLLSNETNYLSRFQYVLLPITLMAWPPFVEGLFRDWSFSQIEFAESSMRILLSALLFVILLLAIFYGAVTKYPASPQTDGRYDVALALSQYRDKNYVMAVSEAGLLPFYSGWRAIDTWGLNDQWIAHNGGITNEYLDRYKPQIIMFHAYFSPIAPPLDDSTDAWLRMTLILKNYAETNHYFLAAVFGASRDYTHYYYVRTDFPDSKDIIKKIQDIKYFMLDQNRYGIDYTKFVPASTK